MMDMQITHNVPMKRPESFDADSLQLELEARLAELRTCAELGDALFQENQRLREEATQSSDSNKELKNELEGMRRAVRCSDAKIKSMAQSIADADSEISSLGSEVDRLKSELERAEVRAARAETELTRHAIPAAPVENESGEGAAASLAALPTHKVEVASWRAKFAAAVEETQRWRERASVAEETVRTF